MSKKAQAAVVAEAEQAKLQTSAQATVAPGAPIDQDAAANEPPADPVRGRALVDLQAHGLKCGEFGTLPAAVAQSLAAAGEFDPEAVEA